IHCRAGIGRSGLVGAAVLLHCGFTVREAFAAISKARGVQVPDTAEQSEWLSRRIERLRDRGKRGDPDMTPDEIQAAIERAEAKAEELQNLDARTAPALKVFTLLPRAAEGYRRQIALGLEGEPRVMLKARSISPGPVRRGNSAGS